MDIDVFGYKLESIQGEILEKYNTELITHDEIQANFVKTPAWENQWPNLLKLLQQEEFDTINENKVTNGISKLEFGALGILWCSGEKWAKAQFLHSLLKPD